MKIRLKKLLSKYKNKIFSFIAVVACIPCFSISTFAYQIEDIALTGYTNAYFLSSANTDRQLRFRFNNASGSTVYNEVIDYHSVDNSYILTNNTISGITQYYIGSNTNSFDIIFNYDLYDYYLYISCHTHDLTDTFSPNRVRVRTYENESATLHYLEDLSVYYHTNANKKGFSVCGKLPEGIENTTISVIDIYSNSAVVGEDIVFEGVVFAFDKGAETSTNQIVTAINNQTSSLGGKIDDTNNFIDKGNGSTGSIVSDNNSAIDNLDEVVSEYRATEETFFNDFNTNQQAITSDIVGWSWGGLVNCADWVGSTLTDYYNNMGDFRQYIIYPLMLGIALFFLGRGGSIIGHLFRKPTETTVNTKSVFRREGNTRYTTTITSRQGGVWRK